MKVLTSENDILIQTMKFLWKERKIVPMQISVAKGNGINYKDECHRVLSELEGFGYPEMLKTKIVFSGDGADVHGISEEGYWLVECKGAGTGKPPTHRNNFDRLLASIVRHYDDYSEVCRAFWKELGRGSEKNYKTFLVIALPNNATYMNQLRKGVRKPLRKALNLYVLLYDGNNMILIDPDEDFNL